MRVENTYDEVLFAAAHAGLEPDTDELSKVRVPAGQDPVTFRSDLRGKAQLIARRKREGNNGEAMRLAEEGSTSYRAQFDELMPIPTSDPDDDLSLTDIGARMFRR